MTTAPARPPGDQLAELVDAVLADVAGAVDGGDGWAVGLEGSLAEGFGNSTSDLDLLLVDPGDGRPPTMPSVLFRHGRRVEVRTRSAGQLVELFRTVAGRRRRPAALGEDLLDRCQRVLGAIWLRNGDVAERIRRALLAELPAGGLGPVLAGWWAYHARQSMRQAVGSAALGQAEDATGWANVGLVQAVKSWAARRGETYLEPKWLALQLARLNATGVAERFRALDTAMPTGPAGAARFVAACVDFAVSLGVTGLDPAPDGLTVDRSPGVTTWPTGHRIHVVRGRDVFALGDTAGRVWRAVVFGQPLPRVLAAARDAARDAAGDAARDAAAAVLAEFLRFGLLRLRAPGGPVTPRAPLAAPTGPTSPPPSGPTPLLGLGGARVDGPDAVDLLPLPADRFSAAAMNLVWSNIVLENLAEDLTGAVEHRQWPAADLAVRRTVLVGLRAVLSAYGVAPLPPDPEVPHRVARLPGAGSALGAAAARATGRPVRGAGDAAAARQRLDAFVRLVRRICGADEFPASFTSAREWRETLAAGYDWLRLGAHLDAPLPIGDARDLLSTGGAQPHLNRDHARGH